MLRKKPPSAVVEAKAAERLKVAQKYDLQHWIYALCMAIADVFEYRPAVCEAEGDCWLIAMQCGHELSEEEAGKSWGAAKSKERGHLNDQRATLVHGVTGIHPSPLVPDDSPPALISQESLACLGRELGVTSARGRTLNIYNKFKAWLEPLHWGGSTKLGASEVGEPHMLMACALYFQRGVYCLNKQGRKSDLTSHGPCSTITTYAKFDLDQGIVLPPEFNQNQPNTWAGQVRDLPASRLACFA